MKPTVPFLSACIALAIAIFAPGAVHAQYSPISLTTGSFNQDLIANGTGTNPSTVTTTSFDATSNIMYNVQFKLANGLTITSGGLPNNGTIVNGFDTYQLQAYTGNNCLFYPAQSSVTAASTKSLTLTTAATFTALSILISGGEGGANVSVSLHFTDGTSSSYGTFTVADWFTGSPSVTSGFGRITRQATVTNNNAGAGNPRMYSIALTLSTTDKVKTMDRVDITDQSTSNTGTIGVFALSGNVFVLPLDLSSLQGQYSAGKAGVELNWQAYNVKAGENFDVERSSNGTSFTTIATIDGIVSGITQSYSYFDAAPGTGSTAYYRVKQVDADLRPVYSNLVTVAITSPQNIRIARSGNSLRILGLANGQAGAYNIYDMFGGRLLRGYVYADNQNTVDLSALPAGVYVLAIDFGNSNYQTKFVKESN